MLHRFGHGHSLALGVLLTLALERHALLVVVIVFAAGMAAGRGWDRLRRLAYAVGENLRGLSRAPRPTMKRKASL